MGLYEKAVALIPNYEINKDALTTAITSEITQVDHQQFVLVKTTTNLKGWIVPSSADTTLTMHALAAAAFASNRQLKFSYSEHDPRGLGQFLVYTMEIVSN